jgi:hypothetical protein
MRLLVWQIPTILAYRGETLAACGAEAREFIGNDEYKIAKWFKVRNIMSPHGADTPCSFICIQNQ